MRDLVIVVIQNSRKIALPVNPEYLILKTEPFRSHSLRAITKFMIESK